MNAKSDSSVVYTDETTICEWMEPDAPKDGTGGGRLQKLSPMGWWRYSMLSCLWKQPVLHTCPKIEKLGRIYLVEERLTDDQWIQYSVCCWKWYTEAATANDYEISHINRWRKVLMHLTADQKIKALAATIRATNPHSAKVDGDGRE